MKSYSQLPSDFRFVMFGRKPPGGVRTRDLDSGGPRIVPLPPIMPVKSRGTTGTFNNAETGVIGGRLSIMPVTLPTGL